MASSRRISFITGGIVAAALSVPALAQATVYCVPDNTVDASCQTPNATIQGALTAASGNAGPDTVRIGPGTFTAPSPGGFSHINVSDPMAVIGSGDDQTIINMPNPASTPPSFTQYVGFAINGPGSSVQDLRVNLPTPTDAANTNQQFFGIFLTGTNTLVSGVHVQSPAATPINGQAVAMDSGVFSDSSILMPVGVSIGNNGVRQVATTLENLTITRADITARDPIFYGNQGTGSLTVSGSRLLAGRVGVEAAASDAFVESTVIVLGATANATGLLAGFENNAVHTSTLSADGLTIAGTGTNQTGARVLGLDANTPDPTGDTVSLDLANSIIGLTGASSDALDRQADNGASVNLSIGYANYDPTTISDTGNPNGATGGITQTNQTDFAPGFLDPGNGDFHLSSSSPLIDLGDPTAPPAGATDFDGDPRAVMGIASCAPRRDIGADEFIPSPPVSPLNCAVPSAPGATKPKKKCKKKHKRRAADTVKKKRCKKKRKKR